MPNQATKAGFMFASFLFFALTACAPKGGSNSQSSDSAAPAIENKSIWCGETIVSKMNLAFKIDSFGAMTQLQDGIRYFPAACNSWGNCWAECKYQIQDGEPEAYDGVYPPPELSTCPPGFFCPPPIHYGN